MKFIQGFRTIAFIFIVIFTTFLPISPPAFFGGWGVSRGVMVKAMDCGIVVSEFVFQSRYYVHFRANTLGERYEPPLSSQLWVKYAERLGNCAHCTFLCSYFIGSWFQVFLSNRYNLYTDVWFQVCIYLTFHHKQDVTQGQLLRGLNSEVFFS